MEWENRIGLIVGRECISKAKRGGIGGKGGVGDSIVIPDKN